MTTDEFFGKEFDDGIVAAINAAREETLRAGVPVFYSDDSGGYIKEMPDGRKFRIRFIPHVPGVCNYEVVCELRSAA